MHRILSHTVLLVAAFFFSQNSGAQQQDSLLTDATLPQVVQYAIFHQPIVNQAKVDESITNEQIKSRLADWLPQVNFAYNLQHNFQVQTNIIGGNPVKLGVDNISNAQFTLKQTIFNPDVLLASRTKERLQEQSHQNTILNEIDVAAEAARAFYAVLAVQQQILVSETDIDRIKRSLQDAYNQYQAGIADKIDYKRTTIALNNAEAALATSKVALEARTMYLKTVIGYPEKAPISLSYDSLQLEQDIVLDTLQLPDYTQRIEYQLLQSQNDLLKSNVQYQKWAYLPELSLNGAYNMNFLNNDFGKLYNTNYPNSFAGLSLTIPIFQGGKRNANIRMAEWQLKRNEWDILNLRHQVSSEYAQAMAAYKSNYANYLALKENRELAQEVYDVLQLQYKSGIKTYLEVIAAETDLRNARTNYTHALYQLLSSKIDVQKSLGLLTY